MTTTQASQKSLSQLTETTTKKFKSKFKKNKNNKFIANTSAELHKDLDITVSYIQKNSGLTFDCKAGCVHCCVHSRVVHVLPSEAFYMVNQLKARLTELEIDGLIKALKIRSETPEEGDFTCVFLKKGICSVYDIRPFTCRRHHSLDVEDCLPKGIYPPEVSKSADLEDLASAQIAGYMSALETIHFSTIPIDLTQALLKVFTDPKAEQRCKKGLPL